MPSRAPSPALKYAHCTAEPVPRAWTAPEVRAADRAQELDEPWDLLLLCTAGYILVAVGRVHQLFPALQAVRPAIITGLFAIVLYLIDRHANRGADLLWVRPTKCLLALLVWMVLSDAGVLVAGQQLRPGVRQFRQDRLDVRGRGRCRAGSP